MRRFRQSLLPAGHTGKTDRDTRRPTFIGRVAVGLVLIGALLLIAAPPAQAQTPSDMDTLRIVNTMAAVGDTFDLEIYLRNVDTLAAARYDL